MGSASAVLLAISTCAPASCSQSLIDCATMRSSSTRRIDRPVRGKCFPACSISRPRILPSAPGLSHAGKTYEAAVKHGEEALIGFLEALQMNGEVIPVERP